MLVWQTLVATPMSSRWRRQASRPSSVLVSTCMRPRRSSLTISDAFDADERRDIAEPRAARRAMSSVMSWPLVKTWK